MSALNVSFQQECDFETLLSSLPNDAVSHLPPKAWKDLTERESTPHDQDVVVLLNNGRKAPTRRDFDIRAKELLYENSDAFATLTRKRDAAQLPVRLAHFRKFWEALDNMAYYWDSSLDHYSSHQESNQGDENAIPPKSPLRMNGKAEDDFKAVSTGGAELSSFEGEPRKKAKTNDASNGFSTQVPSPTGLRIESLIAHPAPSNSHSELPARLRQDTPKQDDCADTAAHTTTLYRGYRIGNGQEMPDPYRIDCVRAFLESVAYAFGVTLSPHRRPPLLTMAHTRFPVRMSCAGWRPPQDRLRARQGWLEGPVFGIQCRAEVNFGATGRLQEESVLDVVRELGGLLLLAQERSRQDKVETRAGSGKWWTTKERWGGGPGGEVGEATRALESIAVDPRAKEEKTVIQRHADGSKVRRKPTPAEIWKVLKSANPLWDPKVVYEAIGKDGDSQYDDIFMVSSLNHHISIVKLHVHEAYVHYLTTGDLPQDTPPDSSWCSPKLSRTKWFDLFSIEDRLEAMRGIWGIMSYQMRSTKVESKDTKMGET